MWHLLRTGQRATGAKGSGLRDRHALVDHHPHTHTHSAHRRSRADLVGCSGPGLDRNAGASCNASRLELEPLAGEAEIKAERT